MGCVLEEGEQNENDQEIAFCYVISRLAQKSRILKCLFDKMKLLKQSNKLEHYNKNGLNDNFQVSMLSKGECTTCFFANEEQLNLRAFEKFLVNLRSGENQSSGILDV